MLKGLCDTMAWNTPADLKYTDTDEWLRIDGDEVTIGITDYAQDQLNDVVYIELPDVGQTLAQGASCGVIESVKAASDLVAPVSGEVTAVNSNLEDEPEVVNEAPYDNGWMIKMKLSAAGELDGLMDADAYIRYCEERG